MGSLLCHGGCGEASPAPRRLLTDASERYAAGDMRAAESLSNEFLKLSAGSPAAGEAHYLRGLSRVRQGNRAGARADFLIGESHWREDVAAYSQVMLANLAWDAGDLEAAIERYATALPRLPLRPPTDAVLYRYGVCLQRVGRWGEARHAFARLLHQYGESAEAAAARRRFAWPTDHLTICCGAADRLEDAERIARGLEGRGLAVSSQYLDLDGRARWRLLTGHYNTYAAAVADLPRVRAIVPEATVVP